MAERTTSYAKEALERRADAVLERYGVVTEEFNQARQEHPAIEQENAPEKDREGGSQMVADAQPRLEPRPPPEIARPVDRENFDERWTQEQNRADDRERGDDYER